MCVCFCLGACAYSYSRVCVCGWDGVKGKTPPFDSLTTQCGQQKYWVLVAGLHFFFFFFVRGGFFFWGRESQMGATHMHFFFSRGNQNDWCYFSGNSIREKHMKWKCHLLSFFFFFFLKCELVLKIAHIHFDFRVKHCELWQNGGRKCWGQILACCRKKKIYNPASWGLSSAPDSLSDLHILYCSRSTLAEPLYLPPP